MTPVEIAKLIALASIFIMYFLNYISLLKRVVKLEERVDKLEKEAEHGRNNTKEA